MHALQARPAMSPSCIGATLPYKLVVASGVARICCQRGTTIKAPKASIDAPKAPSGVGYGEGFPLPSRLRSLGERREFRQAAIALSACFKLQNCLKNCKFHFEKVVVTVTTTFKSGVTTVT